MILSLAQVSISPDPLVFFFTHSTAFVLACGAVFFVLGLIFGRLTWGRYKRQTRLLIAEAEGQKNEIGTLKRKLAEMAARSGISSGIAETDIQEEARAIAKSDPVMASFLATASTILPATEAGAPVIKPSPPPETPTEPAPTPIPLSKLLEVRAKPQSLAAAPVEGEPPASEKAAPSVMPVPTQPEPETTATSPEPAVDQAPPEARIEPAPAKEVAPPPSDLPSAPPGEPSVVAAAALPAPAEPVLEDEEFGISPAAADLIKAKRDALRALIEGSRITLPAPVTPADIEDEIEEPPTIEPSAAALDIPAGGSPALPPAATGGDQRLHSDPYLGLIYTSPPVQSDDLTHLKGVASVIERRLNEFGVYTFKQIALWTEEHVREFSRRLSFKDRISRERWVEQARELHFQKYSERV